MLDQNTKLLLLKYLPKGFHQSQILRLPEPQLSRIARAHPTPPGHALLHQPGAARQGNAGTSPSTSHSGKALALQQLRWTARPHPASLGHQASPTMTTTNLWHPLAKSTPKGTLDQTGIPLREHCCLSLKTQVIDEIMTDPQTAFALLQHGIGTRTTCPTCPLPPVGRGLLYSSARHPIH